MGGCSSRCSSGSAKAAVLPEPVGASAQQSAPDKIAGIARSWTGVGTSQPCAAAALNSSEQRPSSPKLVPELTLSSASAVSSATAAALSSSVSCAVTCSASTSTSASTTSTPSPSMSTTSTAASTSPSSCVAHITALAPRECPLRPSSARATPQRATPAVCATVVCTLSLRLGTAKPVPTRPVPMPVT